MKLCPKCSNEHTKLGKFCSHKCANSRSWDQAAKDRKSRALKGRGPWNNTTFQYGNKLGVPAGKQNWKHGVVPKTLAELLASKTRVKGQQLKKLLITAGLKKDECERCRVGPEWNGLPLVLQVHHLDGDETNNTLNNLQISCPNCHSQTETYAGRNRHRRRVVVDAVAQSVL